MKPGTPTGVFASDGTEICAGDKVEVWLPERNGNKPVLLAEGIVVFNHGSFKILKKTAHLFHCPRLDDFSYECVFNILESWEDEA